MPLDRAFTTIETNPPFDLHVYICSIPCNGRKDHLVLQPSHQESTAEEIGRGWPQEWFGARFVIPEGSLATGLVKLESSTSPWSNTIPKNVPDISVTLGLIIGVFVLATFLRIKWSK